MGKEHIPVQHDMFTGEWVDARSEYHKRRDRQNQNQSQQIAMFSAGEVFQWGVTHRPWLNELPRPSLELEIADTRTPEEKERDLLRQAEALTLPLFTTSEPDQQVEDQLDELAGDFLLFGYPFSQWQTGQVKITPLSVKNHPEAIPTLEHPPLKPVVNIGYRARLRQQQAGVRPRTGS